MQKVSLGLAVGGAVLATIALAVGEAGGPLGAILTLSPYAVLLLVLLLVQMFGTRPASRRAALGTSIAMFGLTAFFYLPMIWTGGGCFSGLAFLLAFLLLPAVPIVFGIAYLIARVAS